MAFSFNGNTPKVITFNNQDVKKLIYNNDVVWEKKRLPVEYQEVEYIESTGTQYIDTGFIPNQDTRTVIVCSATQYLGRNTALFGSRNTFQSKNYSIVFGSGDGTPYNNVLYSGYDIGNVSKPSNALSSNTIYTIDKNKNKTYVNNSQMYSQVYNNFTSPYTMFLFAVHQSSSDLFVGYLRIYSCKIYDNGTLVRNFIPCYRKSDNVAGLYDKVTNTFYINSGTGEFIKGYK